MWLSQIEMLIVMTKWKAYFPLGEVCACRQLQAHSRPRNVDQLAPYKIQATSTRLVQSH